MTNFIISTDGLKEKYDSAYNELRKNIKSPNVLILGQTGVGKSSLINLIFGDELASVSNTKPETRGFHKYSNTNTPVNIIDSEGYELENSNDFKNNLLAYLNANFSNISEQIHIAWYCISISNSRVLPYDIENIQFLLDQNIPVCVVLTQCDNDTPEGEKASSLSNVIYGKIGRKVKCFQVSNDEDINKELDVDKLIEWTLANLKEDNLKLGFSIAQKANLEVKRETVNKRINYYTGTAALIGGSPIPMSDAVLLTGLQVTMAYDIFSIYGIENSLSSTMKNIIGGRVISILGKSVAGNLLKLIPGLGTLVGGLINAGVASSITYAMGYALSELSFKVIKENWNGNVSVFDQIFTEENINQMFDEAYKQRKK